MCLATLSLILCLVEGLYSAASLLMTPNLAPSLSIAGALHDCTDLGSMLLDFYCGSVLDCLGIWGWEGSGASQPLAIWLFLEDHWSSASSVAAEMLRCSDAWVRTSFCQSKVSRKMGDFQSTTA